MKAVFVLFLFSLATYAQVNVSDGLYEDDAPVVQYENFVSEMPLESSGIGGASGEVSGDIEEQQDLMYRDEESGALSDADEGYLDGYESE